MKVVGLNGRVYSLRLRHRRRGRASDPHVRARGLLRRLWPMEERYEEVFLPGCDRLFADFLLPLQRLVVEVQGRQHTEHVPHFHGPVLGFWRSLARDGRKRDWCELNAFRLVELPDGESDDEWTARLRG